MDGAEAEELRSIAEPMLLSYGFRAADLMDVADRARPVVRDLRFVRPGRAWGRRKGPASVYRQLKRELESAGYYSYRLGIAGMSDQGREPAYGNFLRTLKSALDPHGILSPGRYIPAAGGSGN